MDKLVVSPSPHQKGNVSTQKIMLVVLISLLPAVIASGIIFGLRAILLIIICAASCVIFEYLSRLVMKKTNTIGDLSAVVTGVLLAMNVPVTLPVWMAIIGSFISIVIVKQLFGGIGQNFANPAIVGRIVLMVSFTPQMTNWVQPFWYKTADITTSATPLSSSITVRPTLDQLFLGTTGGSLGETCALALLIGGIILVVTKVISPTTPIAFIGTLFVFSLIANLAEGISFDVSLYDATYQILAGGAMLGAIFMATDYATTPINPSGKIIFGVGCGLITFLIRQFGSYPEGVSFSILLMNILTPYIDNATITKPLGAKKPVKEAKQNA